MDWMATSTSRPLSSPSSQPFRRVSAGHPRDEVGRVRHRRVAYGEESAQGANVGGEAGVGQLADAELRTALPRYPGEELFWRTF